jgi:Transposase DDE domain group 1
VKLSKSQVHTNVQSIPELRFEDQRLSSFSGCVLFQSLFQKLNLRDQLCRCFEHRPERLVVGFSTIVLITIVHLMLGFRRLRDIERYRDDPVVLRTLGLRRIPNVSTVCRSLARTDRSSVENVRLLSREYVVSRLDAEKFSRLTLDFDGSVISTGKIAEGTAVGYNNKRKGERSYYPLLCTVAQTAQVLDVFHRSGNVHDSHKAIEFMKGCIEAVRTRLPGVILESRKDAAFFSEKMVNFLDSQGVQFSISVPFECFAELKLLIESRRRWKRLDSLWDFFESDWAPKCWHRRYRFLFLRHRVKRQNKEPVQLGLFLPYEEGYEFKVIVTNKRGKAKSILLFHNGRSSQENLFSELKSQCNMDYVPTRRLPGNQLYFLSAVFAHNLYRELQMTVRRTDRSTTPKRAALWIFEEATSLRAKLIQRAGRLTRPHGRLRLTLSGNEITRKEIMHYLDELAHAA